MTLQYIRLHKMEANQIWKKQGLKTFNNLDKMKKQKETKKKVRFNPWKKRKLFLKDLSKTMRT